jgi:hypothetical protein
LAAGSLGDTVVYKGFVEEFTCRQVLHVSSNANNGSNAGTFTFNGNNDSGNRNQNIGSQLAVVWPVPQDPASFGRRIWLLNAV